MEKPIHAIAPLDEDLEHVLALLQNSCAEENNNKREK